MDDTIISRILSKFILKIFFCIVTTKSFNGGFELSLHKEKYS